jgi:hypothetical protein
MYTELFNTYDKDKKGVITAECMYDIGNLLGKDPAFSILFEFYSKIS